MLKSIRGIAMVVGGFIITLGGGKRTGVHVDNREELLNWSTSLATVISHTGPGIGSGRIGRGGDPRNARTPAILQREDKDDKATMLAAAKPVARSPGWVPRVATLATKAHPSTPKKTIFSDRALGGKRFACKTHPAAVMRDLNKDYAVVSTARVHQANEVTDKIGNSSDCQMRPRFPKGVLADARLVGKVTDHSRESLEEGASTRARLT
mmetsp:Transcript_115/g.271  ORF Transcript_115/g.271 Transcript_115/m.271 type:complete len:209 (+) Transcript_115:3-629(+)